MQGVEVEIIDETAEEFEDDGVKLIRRVLNESDPELSITDADIIVADGRGMGSAENFGLIRELAGLIAAGCRRQNHSVEGRPASEVTKSLV